MPSLSKAATAALGATLAMRQSNDASLGIATPAMGYNTYNDVGCTPTESHSNQQIDAMVSQGFRDAGYKFFQIDCGWQGSTRDKNQFGAIDTDTDAFPNGIPPVSQKARDNGLIFSMYSDAGIRSCDTRLPPTRLGSAGYEEQDAKQFASWNVEYVKYDYCFVDGTDPEDNAPKDPRTDYVDNYSKMWNALQANNIPRMEICQWGTPYRTPAGALQGPVEWTDPLSTSFRLSDDINDDWVAVTRIINQSIYIAREDKSGPNHFADADMLIVGNGKLTLDEQKAHFAYWAMAKSALMIGTNMATINADSKNILLNADLIAVNQDSLGKPVVLVQRYTDDHDLFRGPLANGDEAVLLLNIKNEGNSLSVDLAKELGISSADIKDLYTGETFAGASGVFTRNNIGAHGAAALRLSNIQRVQAGQDNVAWVEAESGSGATVADCAACSGGKKAGGVGYGSTLTLGGVQASGDSATVLFDYVNAEIGYLSGQGQNARTATVTVNGGAPQTVSFPISGYDWSLSVAKDYRVNLTGFRAGGDNTVAITNSNGWAPDFDRLGVIQ